MTRRRYHLTLDMPVEREPARVVAMSDLIGESHWAWES